MPSRETTWSIAADGYAFLCGIALLATIQPTSEPLLNILEVRTGCSTVVMAAPATLV